MDFESFLCDCDEQATAIKKGSRAYKCDHTLVLENGRSDLGDRIRSKKLSRSERHKPDTTDIQCEWEKFPEVTRKSNRRNRNDFELITVKMAIINDKYPNVLLTPEVSQAIHCTIFDMLYDKSDPSAKIGLSFVSDGSLRVNCYGLKAVEWLKGLEGISIQGVKLKIVTADEVPALSKMMPSSSKATLSLIREPNDSSEEVGLRKQENKMVSERQRRYFRNTPNSNIVRKAIVTAHHPEVQIKKDMVWDIYTFVRKKWDAEPDPRPRVIITNLVGGALRVVCEDTNSADWLTRIDGESLNGIILRVVNVKDLPKPVKMIWTTKKHLTDTSKMLEYLQRWNPKLQTNNWKILYTNISGYYLRRIVLMDVVSANVIKAAKYTLYAGVEFTRFRVCEKKGNLLQVSETKAAESNSSSNVPSLSNKVSHDEKVLIDLRKLNISDAGTSKNQAEMKII